MKKILEGEEIRGFLLCLESEEKKFEILLENF